MQQAPIPPKNIKKNIEDRLIRFVVPHKKKNLLKIENFAANKDMVGIELANITLHSDIMLIRNVLQYMNQKETGEALSNTQYFTV